MLKQGARPVPNLICRPVLHTVVGERYAICTCVTWNPAGGRFRFFCPTHVKLVEKIAVKTNFFQTLQLFSINLMWHWTNRPGLWVVQITVGCPRELMTATREENFSLFDESKKSWGSLAKNKGAYQRQSWNLQQNNCFGMLLCVEGVERSCFPAGKGCLVYFVFWVNKIFDQPLESIYRYTNSKMARNNCNKTECTTT